jgi:hypothetical protein
VGIRARLHRQAVIEGREAPHRVVTPHTRKFRCHQCGEVILEDQIKDHPHFLCQDCHKQAEVAIVDPIKNTVTPLCRDCLVKLAGKNDGQQP